MRRNNTKNNINNKNKNKSNSNSNSKLSFKKKMFLIWNLVEPFVLMIICILISRSYYYNKEYVIAFQSGRGFKIKCDLIIILMIILNILGERKIKIKRFFVLYNIMMNILLLFLVNIF